MLTVVNSATDLIRDVYEPIFSMTFNKNNRVGKPPKRYVPPPIPQYTRKQWNSALDKVNTTEKPSNDDMFYAMRQILYTLAAPVMNPEINEFARALDERLGIPSFPVANALNVDVRTLAQEFGSFVREGVTEGS